MSIHVSPVLDKKQRIHKPISFYELVELMVYGKLAFDRTLGYQPPSVHAAKKENEAMLDLASSNASNPSGNMTPIPAPSASPTVAGQSWVLLDDDEGIAWGAGDTYAPPIHIVSTVHALASSLWVSESTDVFIAPISNCESAQSRPAETSSRDVSPNSDGSSLSVMLWTHNDVLDASHHPMLWLPIDLNTLVTRVVVSPEASTRFVDVVAELVQRICRTTVSRATSALEPAIVGIR